MLLADIGLVIILLEVSFTHSQSVITIADMIADAKVLSNPAFTEKTITWDWINFVINLGVNTIATLLIIYRAWYISIFYPYFSNHQYL